jgi:hypothetical protein
VLADLRQVPLAIEAVRRIDEILFRCAGIARSRLGALMADDNAGVVLALNRHFFF